MHQKYKKQTKLVNNALKIKFLVEGDLLSCEMRLSKSPFLLLVLSKLNCAHL